MTEATSTAATSGQAIPTEDRQATAPSSSRARSFGAALCGALAVLLLAASVVVAWAEATVLRAETAVTVAEQSLDDPEVVAALATWLTDELFDAIAPAELGTELPPAVQRIQPVLASGARSVVERQLERVLGSAQVEAVVGQLVARAHGAAMQLLSGDGLVDGITVEDGEVALNTLPLIARGLTAAQQVGLFGDVDVPTLTIDGDPQEQIAELSAATGRDLPSDFGQLVVYRSDRLAEVEDTVEWAQRIVAVAERAGWLLITLTVVLLGASLLLAQERWGALLRLALAVGVAMVLLRQVVDRVVDNAPDLAESAGGHAAIRVALEEATRGLSRLAGIVLLVALVCVAVAAMRRRWQRPDLALVAAVAVGTAVVVILGFSAVSLLLGVLAGIAVAIVERWAVSRPPGTGTPGEVTPLPT